MTALLHCTVAGVHQQSCSTASRSVLLTWCSLHCSVLSADIALLHNDDIVCVLHCDLCQTVCDIVVCGSHANITSFYNHMLCLCVITSFCHSLKQEQFKSVNIALLSFS
jgi:hypothetical protein